MKKSFRFQQWKMLLVTMFCYLFFYTGRHNFGWASTAMAKDLHIPYTTIGWISFAMLVGYAIGQLINGNLADRFSARIMVSTGAYLSILTNFAISYAHTAQVIMILWGLNGYFQSMAWAPGGKLINNWWKGDENGKAFGFYTMAAGLSSAVTYLLSIILTQQGLSWHWLFRIPVLFLLGSATVFLIIARDRPKDLGYQSIEDELMEAEKETWQSRYRKVFKNKNFLLISLSFGFESMARYGLIFWVPVHYLGSNWKNSPNSIWVTFLLPVGMAIGALCFGTLSQRLFNNNRVRSIVFGMLASAVIAIIVYFSPPGNIVLASILMFAGGFFVYGPQACFWPLSPELLGNKLTGTGIGFMNMCGYVFAALGEPLLGFVIDHSHQTDSIFLVISGICVLSAGIIGLTKTKSSFVI